MKLKVDFHIHTCLSPCGGDEMTPNNVVNLAKLMGYDAIAISDHNTCYNFPAAETVGKEIGLTVIPSMELTTAEDIHVVCLFPCYDNALKFKKYVDKKRMKIENDVKINGEQQIMNADDEVIGHEKHFLPATSNIGIYEVAKLVNSLDGFSFPAHVDREFSGLLPILGGIDKDMGFTAVEISKHASENYAKEHKLIGNYRILYDSDAHYLEGLIEPKNFIEADENTAPSIISALKAD